MFLPVSCAGCGSPERGPCPSCWESLVAAPVRRNSQLDALVACSAYEGSTAALVAALKFAGAHRLAPALARAMAALVGDPVDAVCWIPATRTHCRRRGYDQGALLARAVAAELGVGRQSLLKRGRGRPQLGRSRADRLKGPNLQARRSPPVVLVVDDVITTGASFEAASAALRRAGALRVLGVAVAARHL